MSDDVTDYQKVAALLASDVEVTALAVKNNPERAVRLVERLDLCRHRLINDPEWRDMRYEATKAVFTVAATSDSDDT